MDSYRFTSHSGKKFKSPKSNKVWIILSVTILLIISIYNKIDEIKSDGVVRNTPNSIPLVPVGVTLVSDKERVKAIFDRCTKRALAQQHDYENELDAIGWAKVLDGERISHDSTSTESKILISRSRNIIAKFKGRSNELFAQNRQDIENSEIRLDVRRDILAGYDKNLSRNKLMAEEVWSLELRIIDQTEQLLAMLTARRNSWHLENDKFIFNDQNNLILFNSYLSEINRIVTKQAKIKSNLMLL